ncbi:universal stress protein A [Spirochaetia bacterium]|nr:universal stress protein A [Spirochaetia bacterium]
MEKPIIPIVFAATGNYAPPLSVALQSIMENADTERNEYRFFILQTDISAEHQALLHAQVGALSGFSLDIIDVSPYTDGFIPANLNYTIAAYYRFLAPYLLNEYEALIYLDCDIICLTDIAGILDYGVDQSVLGAARRPNCDDPEESWLKVYPKGLGLANYRDYFNSGVLVINTKPFTEMISREALFEMAVTTTNQFPDQDILNILCEGRVGWFPMKWNSLMDKDIPTIPDDQVQEYEESRANPAIIHLNNDKPWKQAADRQCSQRQHRFWDYASRTPFNEVLRAMLAEYKERTTAPIDPALDEAIFFSNDWHETEATEVLLKTAGIATKRGSGAEGCAFNVYVSKDDVEKAFAVLMETGGDK